MADWPLKHNGPCACRFVRREEFGEAEQVEWCGLHAKQRDALNELVRYFTSGNGVPVERATIHAKDFWRITGMTPNERS